MVARLAHMLNSSMYIATLLHTFHVIDPGAREEEQAKGSGGAQGQHYGRKVGGAPDAVVNGPQGHGQNDAEPRRRHPHQ